MPPRQVHHSTERNVMTRERKLAVADMALQLSEDYKNEVCVSVELTWDEEDSVMISRFPDYGYKSTVIFTPRGKDRWYAGMEYRHDPDFSRCEMYISEIAEEMETRKKETRDEDFAYWMED